MKHFLFLVFLYLLMVACSPIYKFQQANKKYEEGAYATAIEQYKKIATKLPQKEQIQLYVNMGESYLQLSNYTLADQTFNRAFTRNANLPKLYLYAGMAKIGLGNYNDALMLFSQYSKFVSGDTTLNKLIRHTTFLRDSIYNQKTEYTVKNATHFNTQKDEYGSRFGDNEDKTLYITSNRDGSKKKKISKVTGTPYSDVFYAITNRGNEWDEVKKVPEPLNSNFADEGIVTFTSDFQTMYFTSCIDKGKKLGCRIYKATKAESEEGTTWTDITEILLFDSTINVAHPYLNADNELYFVSDAPGGYGGMDIWLAHISPSGVGEIENLGPSVNTDKDEMYPYMRSNGELYFSSNGHQGYGGLDIFSGKRNAYGGWDIKNMGIPINSNGDDFAITFFQNENKGYFSSNRSDGKGGDDIYEFELPEVTATLTVTVADLETSQPLSNANVRLINNMGNVETLLTNNAGRVNTKLVLEADYLISVNNKKYFSKKVRFSTKGITKKVELTEKVLLQSSTKTFEIPNVFYAFGSAELSEEAKTALLELVTIMNDNPNVIIELASHTDSRGDSTYNVRLSQQRAQNIVNFLQLNGIEQQRVIPKGYGANQPREIDKTLANKYKFLKEGDILNDDFIAGLTSDEEEAIVDQLNRRTEFKVVEEEETEGND